MHKTALQEFEDLLNVDDSPYALPGRRWNIIQSEKSSSHPKSVQSHSKSSKPPSRPKKRNNKEVIEPTKLLTKLFEIRRPSYSFFLSSLVNGNPKKDPEEIKKRPIRMNRNKSNIEDKKKKMAKTTPDLGLLEQKQQEIKKTESNDGRTSVKILDSIADQKNVNKDLQKSSYNELLLLFRGSSLNPTKAFQEDLGLTLRKERFSSLERRDSQMNGVNGKGHKSLKDVVQLLSHHIQKKEDPQDIEAIQKAQKTIQQLVDTIQEEPGQIYPISFKYESQRMETNNWKEALFSFQPAKVEIVIVDIVNFGILDRTEVIIKSEFSQDIGTIINQMIKQITGLDNEGKHVLIYFYNRQGQRKLFFSKFFFIVKNNHPYPVGLKNEKETIMYYLIILGIFHFRLRFDDKPVSEAKLNAVKTKSLNLVKETDTSVSPYLSEWLNFHVRQQIFVEKYYLNQNAKGKTDVNFMFHLTEYLNTISSRFLITVPIKPTSLTNVKSTTPLPFSIGSSQANFYKFFQKEASLSKSNTLPTTVESSGIKENPQAPNVLTKKMNVFFDTSMDNQKQQITTIPSLAHINSSPRPAGRNIMNSVDYLAPPESPQHFSIAKDVKARPKKALQISNDMEFVDLGIKKPAASFEKLNAYFKTPNQSLLYDPTKTIQSRNKTHLVSLQKIKL